MVYNRFPNMSFRDYCGFSPDGSNFKPLGDEVQIFVVGIGKPQVGEFVTATTRDPNSLVHIRSQVGRR